MSPLLSGLLSLVLGILVLVWPGMSGLAEVHVEDPAQAIVAYLPGSRRTREAALKRWTDDDGRRVGVDLYVKDESTHPTGSLKHRLARSLFLYALCNGWIDESTTVIEASSGSTAVSEAYFAKLIGADLRWMATTAKAADIRLE